jgi:hypothetical protein
MTAIERAEEEIIRRPLVVVVAHNDQIVKGKKLKVMSQPHSLQPLCDRR